MKSNQASRSQAYDYQNSEKGKSKKEVTSFEVLVLTIYT